MQKLTVDFDGDRAADGLTNAVVSSTDVHSCCISLYVVHSQQAAFLRLTPAAWHWTLVLERHTQTDRSTGLVA